MTSDVEQLEFRFMSTEWTISDYITYIGDWAQRKGWVTDADTIEAKMCLIHSEISEAVEHYRNGNALQEIFMTGNKPDGVPVELADVLIRIFEACYRWHIPLQEALRLKLAYNETRLPRHGGKII